MAYVGGNLTLVFGTFDGVDNIWFYKTTDPIATVNTAGYISDATKRGMRVQDTVLVKDTATPTQNWCVVIAITAGAADLSDGTPISQTNTD